MVLAGTLETHITWTLRFGLLSVNCYLPFEATPKFTLAVVSLLASGSIIGLDHSRTDLFPALLSFCPRTNITVAHAYLQEQWLIPLHPRLTSVASSQLGAIQLALADVALLPHVPDRRGIGNDLQPFSSHGFYLWHMEQRPIDSFSDCIWSNAAILRCKHFLWLVHHNRLPSAALLHHR